jgi:arabinose-5-phosphate isomerase
MMKKSALRVLEIEQTAIAQLAQYIDANFVKACELILSCKGKVIVCGMGNTGKPIGAINMQLLLQAGII